MLIKEEEKRLKQFEDMLREIQENFKQTQEQLNQLRKQGKNRTAAYGQLQARKYTLQKILLLYEAHGLINRE